MNRFRPSHLAAWLALAALLGPGQAHASQACATSEPHVSIDEPYPHLEEVCVLTVDGSQAFLGLSWSLDARGIVAVVLSDTHSGNLGSISCWVDAVSQSSCTVALPSGSRAHVNDAITQRLGVPAVFAQIPLSGPTSFHLLVRPVAVSILGGPWIATQHGEFRLDLG